jgi:hypothetical protein
MTDQPREPLDGPRTEPAGGESIAEPVASSQAPAPAPTTPPPAPAPTAGQLAAPGFAPAPAYYSADPELMPPPTTPVLAGLVRGAPRSRLRWGIALLVVALVAAITSAAFFLLSGRAAASPMLAYAPSGSVMYAEMRGDLPGDQRQQLGAFLSGFPGFADQSILDDKLTETLDRLVRAATSGKHSYATEIKPWWGGGLAVDVPALPDSDSGPDTFRGAGYLTVTDGARAQAWLRDQLGGATTTSETYDGVQLTVSAAGEKGIKAAYGVDGSILVVGDLDTVKASLDARRHQSGRTSLADDANVKQALAALPGDHLVFGFVDSAHLLDWSRRMSQGAGSTAMPDFSACSPAGPLTWSAFSLRADGKTIRVDSIQPTSTGRVKLTRTASRVALRLPGNTIVQVDVHDVGILARGTLDACRKVPEIASALVDVDKAVGALGGWDGLLGWIGDTDIVVTRDGTTVAGGLVGVAADKAGATRIVTQLRNLVALSGSTQIAIKDEDHNGTTITTISSNDEKVIGTTTSVALAVRDDLVVIGIGADFVKRVLDVKAGASLADQDRYKQAIGRVEGSNEQQVFIDVSALRSAIESAAPSADLPHQYETDYKPYLEPFDLVAGSTSTTDELVRAAFVLIVK